MAHAFESKFGRRIDPYEMLSAHFTTSVNRRSNRLRNTAAHASSATLSAGTTKENILPATAHVGSFSTTAELDEAVFETMIDRRLNSYSAARAWRSKRACIVCG